MNPRIIARGIVLRLGASAVAPVAAQYVEITFVFISETGNEYSYTLLGPESNTWIGSVHANGSEVITGPPGLYGYILDGPDGNQCSGHIALLAGGRAEVIFDDFSVTERVDKLAPSTEPGATATTGTVSALATFVFTSHTGT